MNPVLLAAVSVGVTVVACYVVANVIRRASDRARDREAARRGGLIDFSRKRV